MIREYKILVGGLPSGYRQVLCLKSSNKLKVSKYIDTLFTPNQDTRIYLDAYIFKTKSATLGQELQDAKTYQEELVNSALAEGRQASGTLVMLTTHIIRCRILPLGDIQLKSTRMFSRLTETPYTPTLRRILRDMEAFGCGRYIRTIWTTMHQCICIHARYGITEHLYETLFR